MAHKEGNTMLPHDELTLMDLAEMYLNPKCPHAIRRMVGDRLLAEAVKLTESTEEETP